MFLGEIFIILMLYFVSSIQRFNYNYLLICTIFYLKQVLLIFPIHNILQILPILILFHDLIDFHQLFFADPSIQICDFFQTGNFAMLMLFQFVFEFVCVYYNRLCDVCQSFCFYLFKISFCFYLFKIKCRILRNFCIRHFVMLKRIFRYSSRLRYRSGSVS